MNDPDNDVWTGPVFGMDLSQETEDSPPDVAGDDIAEEPVVVDASQVSTVAVEVRQENSSVTEELAVEEGDPVHKPKRNTVSYAKKKLLGGMDLFLDPLYKEQFNDPSVLLVGQVKECPRESNGKRYRVQYSHMGQRGREFL